MDQRDWNFLYSAISALIGIALGGATFAIAAVSGNDDPKLEALGGLLVGLMASILSMQILQNRELANLEHIARNAVDAGARDSQGDSISNALVLKLNRLRSLPPLVQNVALRGLEAAIEGIHVEEDKHSTYIEGRRLALKCYARFWDDILDLQAKAKRPLIARVTHSSELDIFYDSDARKLKSSHSTFTERGHMFRMLIDRQHQTSKRVKKYLEAIADMRGISCVYINVFGNHYLLKDHEHMEFCIVDGFGNYCSEWKIHSENQVQAYSLTMERKRYKQSMDTWNSMLARIREYSYDNDSKEHRQDLIDLRDAFIAKYDSVVR